MPAISASATEDMTWRNMEHLLSIGALSLGSVVGGLAGLEHAGSRKSGH